MQITQKKYMTCVLDEDIHSLCNDLNIDESEIQKINGKKQFSLGDVVLLSRPYTKSYVVNPLDTKEHIAKTLGISVGELDKITKGKNLFLGQKIII